nr:TMV resistance protein N-like [Ipomoea batatas]
MLEANEPAKETINMNYGKKRKLAEFLGISEGHLSKKSQYGFFWHSRDCAEASNVLIFTSDAFLKMQRLKFLQLNSAKLIGSYEQFPKRLRWLCWHGVELESIPSDFPLESLIALDLRYNSFKQVWKGSRFPIAFSNLSMLESLDLSNNLVCSLPESIKCLRGLRNLKFTSCPRLKSLIGLPHISKRLNADDCISLEKISYQAELEEGFRMFCRGCKILAEIEGYFKLEPLENVNTDICGILGLPNLETIRNIMVKIRSRYLAKLPCLKLSPQILYQPGIFTTFLPGDCIPSWFNSKFTFTSPQSSFTLPAIENYRIQGLSFCLVYLCSDDKEAEFTVIGPSIQIDDQTKLVSWRLQPPYFGIPNGREGMMCLSHWNLGSQLQSGDFLMVLAQVVGPLRFKELGIKIWYVEEQQVNTEESSIETVSKHANPCGDVVPVEIPGQPRYFLWLESMRLKKPM